MKNKKKKQSKKILLISLLVLAAAILAVALMNASSISEIFEFGIIPSEIMIMVMVFLFVIPVMLIIIIIAWIKDRQKSKEENKVIFGGRLGMYKYFDMHQVVDEALKCVKKELEKN